MVLLSASPRNSTLMPCLGATSFAMYSISDCSAALPSLVATTRVAPAISLADSVSPKNSELDGDGRDDDHDERERAIQIHFGRASQFESVVVGVRRRGGSGCHDFAPYAVTARLRNERTRRCQCGCAVW